MQQVRSCVKERISFLKFTREQAEEENRVKQEYVGPLPGCLTQFPLNNIQLTLQPHRCSSAYDLQTAPCIRLPRRCRFKQLQYWYSAVALTIEKYPRISESMQFRLVLFKGQLCFH